MADAELCFASTGPKPKQLSVSLCHCLSLYLCLFCFSFLPPSSSALLLAGSRRASSLLGIKWGGPIEGLCHMSHALIYISKSKQLTVLLRNPTIPTRERNNNQKKRDRERVSSSIFRSFFRLRAHIIKNNKNLRRF